MLFRKLYHDRWFIWTLVFLFVAGSALIGYIQWSTIELDTANTLLSVY